MLLVANGTLQAETKAPKASNDTVYKGTTVKLDLFNTVYTLAATGGKTYSYEAAANVNLLNKYFPTIEIGYAGADQTMANDAHFNGTGAFMRIGSDFNLMKKKKNTSGNFFLGGVRFGMAMQQFDTDNLLITDNYWNTTQTINYTDQFKFDCWAEIVAGIQVNVYRNFTMGWAVRAKFLITRGNEGQLYAWYIPGYGTKDTNNWGFNYYIAYTF